MALLFQETWLFILFYWCGEPQIRIKDVDDDDDGGADDDEKKINLHILCKLSIWYIKCVVFFM